ncbi:MAG TPA: TM0106 family RecB-like putative nuclease, partial [Acidimicrobiales bacterium]
MYLEGTRLVLSPTDLVGFTACAHLTELSVEVAHKRLTKPQRDDPQLELVQRRGMDHEHNYLAQLQQAGLGITEITGTFEQSVADTLDTLRQGPDVIYQAAFLDDSGQGPAWRGHADFLRRVSRPSQLGAFSYEPEDTKLARRIKPGAVLQLCDYAAHLERLTGVAPEEIHVVLGGQTMESLRLLDYAAYYRATKARFKAALAAGLSAYPTPVSHCSICVWRERCDEQRVTDDHLSLVAGMRAEQARKLEAAGVPTTAALAAAPLDLEIPRLATTAYEKLHQQARLQVQARSKPDSPPPYELLPATEPGRGLRALPEPSPGDLFFDIEGDPFFESEGLEYLFGFGWVGSDRRFAYRAFWGTSREEEKRAFEDLIDFIQEQRAQDPGLHVYHYAPYEPSALQRLMGRHGTRREEIDELLRADVLVDLLQVVRQSARIGVPSYGLKKIEALFMTPRSGDITDGGSSIVEFERWLESADQSILDSLESYNRDDCESTQLLRDWLEGLRRQYGREFGAEPERPGPKEGTASDSVAEEAELNAELAEALVAAAAPGPGGDASQLLAQLLEWHRDEEKPEWWKYFERIFDLDEEGLFFDSEAVTGLEPVEVDPELEPGIDRYAFVPEQEHKLAVGKTWIDPDAHRRRQDGERLVGLGKIVAVDPVHGLVDLARTRKQAAVPRSLIPPGPVNTKAQRDALRRVATSVIEHGIDGPGPFRATRDLLLRRPPRLTPSTLAGLGRLPNESSEAAVVRLAGELDRGTLAVQGPPGSGKTRTAAETIAALV